MTPSECFASLVLTTALFGAPSRWRRTRQLPCTVPGKALNRRGERRRYEPDSERRAACGEPAHPRRRHETLVDRHRFALPRRLRTVVLANARHRQHHRRTRVLRELTLEHLGRRADESCETRRAGVVERERDAGANHRA